MKLPAQTKRAMRVREENAKIGMCLLIWQEGDLLYMECQDIQWAG